MSNQGFLLNNTDLIFSTQFQNPLTTQLESAKMKSTKQTGGDAYGY